MAAPFRWAPLEIKSRGTFADALHRRAISITCWALLDVDNFAGVGVDLDFLRDFPLVAASYSYAVQLRCGQ